LLPEYVVKPFCRIAADVSSLPWFCVLRIWLSVLATHGAGSPLSVEGTPTAELNGLGFDLRIGLDGVMSSGEERVVES